MVVMLLHGMTLIVVQLQLYLQQQSHPPLQRQPHPASLQASPLHHLDATMEVLCILPEAKSVKVQMEMDGAMDYIVTTMEALLHGITGTVALVPLKKQALLLLQPLQAPPEKQVHFLQRLTKEQQNLHPFLP